jgi:hypothetical protein
LIGNLMPMRIACACRARSQGFAIAEYVTWTLQNAAFVGVAATRVDVADAIIGLPAIPNAGS